ncbi:hypothetical protein J6590_032463 [Homalodisca vitripennis]|nr:hypothetical protein J6590_032463 [Homalodisca vitripennis]
MTFTIIELNVPHIYTNIRATFQIYGSVRLKDIIWIRALVAKVAIREHKAFCVLRFAKTESVVTEQRAFRIKFESDPPSDDSMRRWYHQFESTGCLCKEKSTGRPSVNEDRVERVRENFTRISLKSVRKTSRELEIPVKTRKFN